MVVDNLSSIFKLLHQPRNINDLLKFKPSIIHDGVPNNYLGKKLVDPNDIVSDDQVPQYDSASELWKFETLVQGGSDISVLVEKTSDQSINDSTWTYLTWDSEVYDTDGFHDNVTNNSRLTIPTGLGGKYLALGLGRFANSSVGFRGYNFVINRSTPPSWGEAFYQSAFGMSGFAIALLELDAGDYIEMRAYQNTGCALNFVYTNPQFSLHKLDKGG